MPKRRENRIENSTTAYNRMPIMSQQQLSSPIDVSDVHFGDCHDVAIYISSTCFSRCDVSEERIRPGPRRSSRSSPPRSHDCQDAAPIELGH